MKKKYKNEIARLVIFCIVLFLLVAPTMAATNDGKTSGSGSITVIFPDDADNCLLESSPDATGDINPYVYAYSRSGGMNRRGLIHFDLSSLPPGATVNSANLYLYMASLKGDNQLHDMHRVNTPWSEATVSWANLPAFESIPTASADTGTVANTWISWDVSSDVQAFLSGTPNYGWLLKHRVESLDPSQYAKYWTKEYETTSLRPYLEVTYTEGGVPAPEFPTIAFPVMVIGIVGLLAVVFRRIG